MIVYILTVIINFSRNRLISFNTLLINSFNIFNHLKHCYWAY